MDILQCSKYIGSGIQSTGTPFTGRGKRNDSEHSGKMLQFKFSFNCFLQLHSNHLYHKEFRKVYYQCLLRYKARKEYYRDTPSGPLLLYLFYPNKRVSTLARDSMEYKSLIRAPCRERRTTPTANTTLVRSTSPSGIIPISNATVLIMDSSQG